MRICFRIKSIAFSGKGGKDTPEKQIANWESALPYSLLLIQVVLDFAIINQHGQHLRVSTPLTRWGLYGNTSLLKSLLGRAGFKTTMPQLHTLIISLLMMATRSGFNTG
jgi:hypothetical protein